MEPIMEEYIVKKLDAIHKEQTALRADFHEFEVTNEHRLTTVEVNAKRSGKVWGAVTSLLTAAGLILAALAKGLL